MFPAPAATEQTQLYLYKTSRNVSNTGLFVDQTPQCAGGPSDRCVNPPHSGAGHLTGKIALSDIVPVSPRGHSDLPSSRVDKIRTSAAHIPCRAEAAVNRDRDGKTPGGSARRQQATHRTALRRWTAFRPGTSPPRAPGSGTLRAGDPAAQGPAGPDDSPFDRWIDHELRQIYNRVLAEPIPPQLLDLIEHHRRKARDGNSDS